MKRLVFSKQEFEKINHIIEVKASRYYYGKERASFDVEDVYQEGWLAFLEACSRFDEKKEFKLLTFANQRINGAMIDFVKYMLTGLRGRDKTGEWTNKREIYFDDDPKFERSSRYEAERIEYIDWLIDCDIFLSRVDQNEKELWIRYYVCDDSFDKIAPDTSMSRATINRLIRSLDEKIKSHLYEE